MALSSQSKLDKKTVFVLHSYEAIKEAFVNQSDIFAGRPHDKFASTLSRDKGIVGSDGEAWKIRRRNALHILKDFGFGKEGSKEIIQNEIEDMFQTIDAQEGTPFETKQMFHYATSNIICAISVNKRPAHVDKKFQQVLFYFEKLMGGNITDVLPIFFPILNDLPFIASLLDRKTRRLEYANKCYTYLKEQLADHKKTFDPNHEARDFLDAMLLLEIESSEKDPDYSKESYEMQIIRIIFELFIAGSDTTATVLGWMVCLMATHPEIQAKVQKELDDLCGKGDTIKMEMKKDLPYMCAVIDEVQRFASIASTSLSHRVTENTKLLGYDIPKDSFVLAHISGVHSDPALWEKPNSFYPEHFLSKDRKFYQPNDHLIIFSLGKRACMGELLASMELFLISASIIRKYNMKLDGSHSIKELEKFLQGSSGGVHRANPHKVIFTRRQV